MYCRKCGKQLQDETTFCPACGEKVIKDEQKDDKPDEGQKPALNRKTAIICIAVLSVIAAVIIFALVLKWLPNNKKDSELQTSNEADYSIDSGVNSDSIEMTEEHMEENAHDSLSDGQVSSLDESVQEASEQSETETSEFAEDYAAFYGIWCMASKDESEADSFAEYLKQKGISAEIVLTSDWSNLNPEPWYAVTSGMYETESDAYDILDSIKQIYPDAYVKYTGEWIGSGESMTSRIAYKETYKSFLAEAFLEQENEKNDSAYYYSRLEYTVFDIIGDETPDLFISDMYGKHGVTLRVYEYAEGELISHGEMDGSGRIYSYNGSLILFSGYKGRTSVEQYMFDADGMLSGNVVYENNVENWRDDENWHEVDLQQLFPDGKIEELPEFISADDDSYLR